jgi:hypothetical protein
VRITATIPGTKAGSEFGGIFAEIQPFAEAMKTP